MSEENLEYPAFNQLARDSLMAGNVTVFNNLLDKNPIFSPSLANVALKDKDIYGIHLHDLTLYNAVFNNVTLGGDKVTDMTRSTMIGAKFINGCILTNIDFSGSNLEGAVFENSNLGGVLVDERTVLKAVKLDAETYKNASAQFKVMWEKANPEQAKEFKTAGRNVVDD